jgi:glycerol-3-phosphate dehydrogenase (NAD(P)+)
MSIAVVGSGAFGTALAVALASKHDRVLLWARNPDHVEQMRKTRVNARRLPDVKLPDTLEVTDNIQDLSDINTILLATPAQTLSPFLTENRMMLNGKSLIACCKGIDVKSMTGPSNLIETITPDATPAILTGPSFAHDIARGLPTALTLACANTTAAAILQEALSTETLRIYRSNDPLGAELGGALKNVVAIACGAAIGARLGESARAALMTRGYAEMQRLAQALGASAETLSGLSGFGDMALTCTSEGSRNYRFGLALGNNTPFDPETTVEGVATAQAVTKLAQTKDIDMPICAVVSALSLGTLDIETAMQRLMTRPLTKE